MVFIIIAILLLLIFNKSILTGESVNVGAIYSTYKNEIDDAAATFIIPAARIVAIIARESSGNSQSVGRAGEVGLMQLMKGALSDFNRAYSQSYTLDDLRDPRTNIQVGTGYLSILAKHYAGDIDKATQAYNAGMANVDRDPNASAGYLSAVKSFETQLNNSTI
jgi:soluble lytic murein transglycosylase-like protein